MNVETGELILFILAGVFVGLLLSLLIISNSTIRDCDLLGQFHHKGKVYICHPTDSEGG